MDAATFAAMVQSSLDGEPGTRARVKALVDVGITEYLSTNAYKASFDVTWDARFKEDSNNINLAIM